MAQDNYNNYGITAEGDEALRRRLEQSTQQPQNGQPPATPPLDPNAFDASRAPSNVPTGWAEDFIRRNPVDYHRISEAYESDRPENKTSQYAPQAPQQPTMPDWYKTWFDDMRGRQAAQDAERKQRADTLYDTWLGRSKQALAVDRNDPIIRQQADAYAANEERARRNYISDLAESAGPLANLRGEQRMASERLGQRTGTFEAELIGRELTTKRNEIAQALLQMGNMLSADQQAGLQRELAILDQAIKERGIALQGQALDQDWQRALLANNQFMADLGLRAENQYNYWNDPLRTR